ncbi:flagellar M-ring protein FliF [Thermomonas sp. S9]|uniref:flagellar basal-body MS-ring/collar protein FliF n=1 Tax=Thermomonas sp. S9 TaxID=2885203 RepID=UPI00216B3E57|nr:flagellar basal-body MS-ring/collar protein FliF [Thermomonas sp. S9]MCR6496379.1 flagellar M-ring protein FliF [Thermomonas sp. S9]
MSAIALPKTPDDLKKLGRLQDIPLVRQLLTLGTAAAAIALGLWLFFWTQKPSYTPLPGLDVKTASEARDLLRNAQVPFKVDPATGLLSVPEDKLGEARMALAGAGLGTGDGKGFEAMEGDQGFGTSQFVENARYQHALETELARTITNLRPVREARVHLALPKPSAFTRQREPASASVVLQLQSGASLEPGQVDAIVHLVASSIPELPASNVTVVDQFGRLLSNPDPDSDAAIAAKQYEQQRRQEAVFAQRIQALLEPITGPGKVRAQVSVDMDFSQTEEAREVYGPQAGLVRSEQVSESGTQVATTNTSDAGGSGAAAQGVPGSASNTPGATPQAGGPGGNSSAANSNSGSNSRSAVRNYEIDRTLTHTRKAPSQIRRITAAVLVDNIAGPPGKNGKPTERALTANEISRIQTLVQQAIGFDSQRGDAVSVVNSPFARSTLDDNGPSAPFWEDPRARDLLRTLLGGIAVLLVVWFVLRPAFRALTTPKMALPQAIPEALLVEQEGGRTPHPALTQEQQVARNSFEEKIQSARAAVNSDSKRVAAVVRDLVNSDG